MQAAPDTFQIAGENLFRRTLKLMGNRFELTVVEEDAQKAENAIERAVYEIRRIESLLTTYRADSQVNRINDAAGISPVKVDMEVVNLINRSLKISRLTQGAFDISYGSIDKRLWNFDTNMKSLPDPATARQMVRLINYRNIIVDEKDSTVFLREQGMRIGFGGIGKGYAADRAKAVLVNAGIKSGIVNASGDLTAWGLQPDGKPWTIGIADHDSAARPFSFMDITDMSVATSGNYEKFVEIGGRRYSHTIDPGTGLPVSGIRSVTIISPIAEIADAMATPVMVMGIEVGLNLINQMQQIACIIIDDHNKIYTSENITLK